MMRATLCIAFTVALSACVTTPTNSSYTASEVGRISTVQKGKILALRLVNVTGDGRQGAAVGGSLGAVAGSSTGSSGRDNVAGAIVGAVVGGAIGSAAEKTSSKQTLTEFIVALERGDPIAIVQDNDKNLTVGDRVLIIKSGTTRVIKDETVAN
jgi:outer membrane lipoprotein SlyB